MFENVLGQMAVERLSADIAAGALPPAVLFAGPPASGKGTAALELARTLSCESGRANWDCACPACARHRNLNHMDNLTFGVKNFSAELGATSSAFIRDLRPQSKLLFIRAVKKLLSRFNPTLWEGEEARLGKAVVYLVGLNEDLDELTADTLAADRAGKIAQSILATARKLEAEALPAAVPIFQVRRAAFWARLAPIGRKKIIIIENIDTMQESARNALLKILEEPPETAMLVLTCIRRSAVMPTILSRVRSYAFNLRDAETERGIIRRVFRDPEAAASEAVDLSLYLDSFLPVPMERRAALAAFFAASAVAAAVRLCGRRSSVVPDALLALGRSSARAAAAVGKPTADARAAVALVMDQADKFAAPSSFSSFLERLLGQLRSALVEAGDPSMTVVAETWRTAVAIAATAVTVYNQTPALCLERLFLELTESLVLSATVPDNRSGGYRTL